MIIATAVAEELQLADVVIFCVVPSKKVPIAVNCSCVPGAIEGAAGVTAIDFSATPTVRVVVPLTAPDVALMVVEPFFIPVAIPAVLIDATVVSDELQVAELVKS